MLDKLFESLKDVSLEESRKTAFDKYVTGGKISEEVFNTLIELDKTPTKKYIDWGCEQYMQKKGDEATIMGLAMEYDKLISQKRVKAVANIMSLSFEDMQKLTKEAPKSGREQHKEKVQAIMVEGAELIKGDGADSWMNKVDVYRVNEKKAAQLLGKGATWCTAWTKKDCKFDQYTKNELKTMYVVISKDKKFEGKVTPDEYNLSPEDEAKYKDVKVPLKFQVMVDVDGKMDIVNNNQSKHYTMAEMKAELGLSPDE